MAASWQQRPLDHLYKCVSKDHQIVTTSVTTHVIRGHQTMATSVLTKTIRPQLQVCQQRPLGRCYKCVIKDHGYSSVIKDHRPLLQACQQGSLDLSCSFFRAVTLDHYSICKDWQTFPSAGLVDLSYCSVLKALALDHCIVCKGCQTSPAVTCRKMWEGTTRRWLCVCVCV